MHHVGRNNGRHETEENQVKLFIMGLLMMMFGGIAAFIIGMYTPYMAIAYIFGAVELCGVAMMFTWGAREYRQRRLMYLQSLTRQLDE